MANSRHDLYPAPCLTKIHQIPRLAQIFTGQATEIYAGITNSTKKHTKREALIITIKHKNIT